MLLIRALEENPLGFGCGASFLRGIKEGNYDPFEALDLAYELGCRFYDTADSYGNANEILGRWTRARLAFDVCIQAKAGYYEMRGLVAAGYPKSVQAAVVLDLVLRARDQLHRESLDVFMLHNPISPILHEALAQVLSRIREERIAQAIGISTGQPDVLCRGLEIFDFDVVDVPFTVVFYPELADILRSAGKRPTITVRSVLGQGLLAMHFSGIQNLDEDDPRHEIEDYLQNRWQRFRSKVLPYFKKHNLPWHQTLIAAALDDDLVDGVILGCRTIEQIKENFRSRDVPRDLVGFVKNAYRQCCSN